MIQNISENKHKGLSIEDLVEKFEHGLVDYLIYDQTQFADLYRIESYYKEEIDKNNKTIDQNLNNVNKQKIELESIELMIEKELIDNLSYNYEEIEINNDAKKRKMKEEIAIKEYDFFNLEQKKKQLLDEKVINLPC